MTTQRMVRIAMALLALSGLEGRGGAPAAAAAKPAAIRVEAAALDAVMDRLDNLAARPAEPQAARELLEASRGLGEGSVREAALHTAALALAGAGETAAARALCAHLAQAYPASAYRQHLTAIVWAAPPAASPALPAMIDECRYLVRSRARALQDETGTADVRESGRNLTPPELKQALKAFADWMVLQQRRLGTRVVARLYATREGPVAVLHMHVTPDFTSQGYDWRLAIARACVKDWAVKCRDVDASAGFRIYDENGLVAGEYDWRNGRLWLPRDGEPPRQPSLRVEPSGSDATPTAEAAGP